MNITFESQRHNDKNIDLSFFLTTHSEIQNARENNILLLCNIVVTDDVWTNIIAKQVSSSQFDVITILF